ncbi:hypothetical protein GYMLUDRAFT_33742 [Collybiopsis luxurians FD-317 M1]|nr:hypothetical protein GYMLUDRAFT_33742 [Collybiopsis luxurians FD-317 M1]
MSTSTTFNLPPTPPPEITPSVSYIDFASTPLKKFAGFYALIIDNLFSPEECQNLISLAESTTDSSLLQYGIEGGAGWQPAKIQVGILPTDQELDTSYRYNDRILRFDHNAAGKIFERVKPFVEKDIGTVTQGSTWGGVVGAGNRVRGTWNLVGLNERLSFLRYGPGHFFKEHYDGRLELPDGRKSRVTIQVYLNGSSSGSDVIEGGATRFYSSNYWNPRKSSRKGVESEPEYLDVEPRTGRVLIFQQRGLLHSGEPVLKGLKYAMRTDFMFEQTK